MLSREMIFSPTRQRRGWMRNGPAKKAPSNPARVAPTVTEKGAPFDETTFREKLNAAALSYGWHRDSVASAVTGNDL